MSSYCSSNCAVYAGARYSNDPDRWQLGYLTDRKMAGMADACQKFDARGSDDLSWERITYATDGTMNVAFQGKWDSGFSQWLGSDYDYDGYGNCVSVTDPKGSVLQIVYGAIPHVSSE